MGAARHPPLKARRLSRETSTRIPLTQHPEEHIRVERGPIAGFTTLGEADFTDNFSNATALGDSDFSSGYSLAAAVGRSWENFRLEGEISYRKNDLDSLTIDSLGAAGLLIPIAATFDLDGEMSSLGFMANGYYDFNTDGKLAPFVMAGIGGANINLDVTRRSGVDVTYDESDMVLAYQAGAGFGYKIGFGTVFNAQYRFFGTLEPTFDDGVDEVESEYLSHNFWIGITQRF